MADTTRTPAQSLAMSDYELLGRLARAVDSVNTGKERVAEAAIRDVAYHAAELAQKAQDAKTAFELVQLTGAQARFPEAAERALEGDTYGVTRAMTETLKEVMGY